MTNLLKKLIYLLSIIISLLFLLPWKTVVHASDIDIEVNFIFEHLTYTKGDTIKLSLNIENGHQVDEIKMGINCSNDITSFIDFANNVEVNKSSGFTKELVNEAGNDEGVKLYLQKENELLQRKICSLKLICKNDIEDIISLIANNLTIYLFDDHNHLLEYKIGYSEKLKATWNILLDELEVFATVPNYANSFSVTNRLENEYEIILKQNIDSSIIGTQVVSIIVIDKVNNDYLLFNKTINVVDKTIPCLSYPDQIILDDTDVETFDIGEYISVVDNYDNNAHLVCSYYNKEEEKLSFDSFKKYLKNHNNGYICFYGVDESKNKTEDIKLEIIVNDTTPPIITTSFLDELIVKDVEYDSFDILSYFNIIDEYDSNPSLVLEVYDKNDHLLDAYKSKLLEDKVLKLKYYGFDKSGNKTNVVEQNIILQDTIAPVIKGLNELILKDNEVNEDFYLYDLEYKDNIDVNPKLEILFYIGEEEVNKYVFLEKIKTGCIGHVLFQAIDFANNHSETFLRKIKVIDTTPPVIKLLDIKNEGKYIKVEQINYEVSDNFNNDIDVYVEINGQEYNNTLINEIGQYHVSIYAKDSSGNESKKEFTFSIIENNIKGCSGDIKCYVDNYSSVIVTVTVLTICSIALVIIKIILERKKSKTKLREIKNDNLE